MFERNWPKTRQNTFENHYRIGENMEENRFQRATDQDDPDRCQASTRQGQCNLKAVSGGTLCLVHGGAMELKNKEKKNLRNYRLAKFQSRTAELGNSDHISSLKDEVALVRLLIEEMINGCETSNELLLRAGPLSDLLMKCERIVTSCHKLDVRLDNLLDRTKVLQFAQMTIEIISSEIKDENVLDSISGKILKALGDL
jgi:hypothetical protein